MSGAKNLSLAYKFDALARSKGTLDQKSVRNTERSLQIQNWAPDQINSEASGLNLVLEPSVS